MADKNERMADANERKVMFVCDKTKECCTSPNCGTFCRHTANPDHALYPVHNNFLRDEHDKNLWWEVEA